MLYALLVWLTYTNIVQSVNIYDNENFNLRFLHIADPGAIFILFLNIFNINDKRITKYLKEVLNIFAYVVSVKKIGIFGILAPEKKYFLKI